MPANLHQLTQRQFAEKLAEVTSPSSPVVESRHLKGREEQTKAITQAIYAPGRHVFIFGERGVGKTSLAKTAGLAAATNSTCFRQIGCAADSTFEEVVRQIVEVFDPEKLSSLSTSTSWGLSQLLSIGSSQQRSYTPPPTITVSAAADILASLDDDKRKDLRVVVVDEIERIQNLGARLKFAELVKLLGDRGARLTIIFTGVGTDLTEILGAHESAFRQFLQIKLERLDYQSSLDIVDDALDRFELSWDIEPVRTARFRIASIANGFPYYVHLLTERLLYALYEDKSAELISLEHLRNAITTAVSSVSEQIRQPYDKATRGRNELYTYATWAAADSWDLERATSDIYASYESICRALTIDPVEKSRLSQVLASLKAVSHGSLLRSGFRQGQHVFVENIYRGYIRLCADAAGVQLHDLRPESPLLTSTVGGRSKRYLRSDSAGSPPRGFERR